MARLRPRVFAVGFFFGCCLAGCATQEAACAIGSPALTVDLFFGRERPGGAPIADAEWARFLADEVTPRFPDGLTAIDARGQWRASPDAPVSREPSTVVTIVMGENQDAAVAGRMDRVEAIREAYRRRFDQQSVGVATHAVCADF